MKRPPTAAEVLYGRKTGRCYESEKRPGVLADHVSLSCQVSISVKPRYEPLPERLRAILAPCFYPHESPKSQISVPGFHHVQGKYIRSDHDNSAANNLLQSFKANETTEVVVKNR